MKLILLPKKTPLHEKNHFWKVKYTIPSTVLTFYYRDH